MEDGDEAEAKELLGSARFWRGRGRSGRRPLDARLRKHEAEETNGSSLLGRQRQSREGEGDAWRGGGGRRQRREMGDRAQGKKETSESKGSMGRGRGDRALAAMEDGRGEWGIGERARVKTGEPDGLLVAGCCWA